MYYGKQCLYAETSKIPDRCVAFGCSDLASVEKGSSLQRISIYDDERGKAKRRRRSWINVKITLDKWVQSKSSVVCSEHFTPDSFS